MTNKEIKTAIEDGNVKLTIAGVTKLSLGDNGELVDVLKVMEVDSLGESIWEADGAIMYGMNIEKLGPTTMKVYTFDLLGNRTKSVVRYSDITILG